MYCKSHCKSIFWMKDDVMWWIVCACAELQDQAASEEDGLDGEAWARPLAQLWQNRPYNPEREREYNREMGLRPPYCAVCTLFQAHQQVRLAWFRDLCLSVSCRWVYQVSDTSCAFLYDVLFMCLCSVWRGRERAGRGAAQGSDEDQASDSREMFHHHHRGQRRHPAVHSSPGGGRHQSAHQLLPVQCPCAH